MNAPKTNQNHGIKKFGVHGDFPNCGALVNVTTPKMGELCEYIKLIDLPLRYFMWVN